VSQEEIGREHEAAEEQPLAESSAAVLGQVQADNGGPAASPPVAAAPHAEQAARSSIWPLALACAVAVLCAGVITHPVVLAIGLLLVVATAAGWALERH
jgi:hypothetical protein